MREAALHVATEASAQVRVTLSAAVASALRLQSGDAPTDAHTDATALVARVHPENRPFLMHALDWARRSGGPPVCLGIRMLRDDGEAVPVRAELGRDPDGVARISIESDETAAARRTEVQVREILEGTHYPLVVRVGERVAFSNRALARMLGYGSLQELRAAGGNADHLHPDDRAMVNGRIAARAAGKGAPENYEFRMIRVDGSVIWIDCIVSPVMWKGEPASMAWLLDITQRKQTEAALRRSEKVFGTVFQACPDLLVLSRLDDGRTIDVNDSFVRILGYERDLVVGRTEREIGIFIDPGTARRLLAPLNDPTVPKEQIAAVRTSSGEERQLLLSCEAIRSGDLGLVLTVGRDVTDRLRVEEELRQSREAAVFANRAKSEFLANMSHELRTPLNAIIGFSEVIAEGLFGPVGSSRYADYARDIQNSGQHLLQIINDLLDLSKLEAGKQPLDETDIAIVDLAEASLRLVRERAREADLTLALDIPAELPAVHADERLLKQIMINLLSNAVKFTEGGGTVTVRARGTADGGIEVSVADTGIGMTAAEIEVALSPFGQVNSALARRHRGTGLGLPLVRSLIELHGGTLRLASEPGAGTTATVALPPARVLRED